MSHTLSKDQALVTYENLDTWFRELCQFLVEVGHPDLLDDPSRIFNADETGVPISPKAGKVLCDISDHHTYQAGGSGKKMQITALMSALANGYYPPPLLVYDGVQPRHELQDKFHATFPEGLFGNSESGWMDSTLFKMYLEDGFEPALAKRGI